MGSWLDREGIKQGNKQQAKAALLQLGNELGPRKVGSREQ